MESEIAQRTRELVDVRHWIKKKLREYQESPRKGIARGERLPVPKHKYHAALLMLVYESKSYPDLYQIAKEANVKYGLIGKWRNEHGFWNLMDRVAGEFLKEWMELYVFCTEELAKDGSAKIKSASLHSLEHMRKVADLYWGDYLALVALGSMRRALKNKELSPASLLHLYRLLAAITGPRLDGKKEVTAKEYKQLANQIVRRLKDVTVQAAQMGDRSGTKDAAEALADVALSASLNLGVVARAGGSAEGE